MACEVWSQDGESGPFKYVTFSRLQQLRLPNQPLYPMGNSAMLPDMLLLKQPTLFKPMKSKSGDIGVASAVLSGDTR